MYSHVFSIWPICYHAQSLENRVVSEELDSMEGRILVYLFSETGQKDTMPACVISFLLSICI